MAPNTSKNPTLSTSAKQDIAILIVDDEAGIRDFLQRSLTKHYQSIVVAHSANEADLLRAQQHFDLIIVDICMPGRSGVEWIQDIKSSGCPSDVIFMTAFVDINNAVEVLRLGASDLILKPFRIEQMRSAVQKCLDNRRLLRENYLLNRELTKVDESKRFLVGDSPALTNILTMISRVSKAPSAVLIEGETGTGKELVARAIHHQSERAGAFVPVNCAALAPDLMESELFGHVKGAFTNAHQAREGLFSYADGGTLFLDEISEMPLAMQSKFLRVLEDGRIRPVGTERDTPVNVRIIAASNKNLEGAVKQGLFREDLYYRLNVLQLNIPPLRQRLEDLPLLAKHLIEQLARELAIPSFSLSQKDIHTLQSYHWPGNVRELRNLIERSLLLRMSPSELLQPTQSTDISTHGYPLDWDLKRVELDHIERVLHHADGNKTKAAEQLGITRKTLERKRQSYGFVDDGDICD